MLTEGYVLLYGINNPLGSCSLIDSINIDNTGFYYFNKFYNTYTGYLVKAMLPPASSLNNQYISTYYDANFSWVYSLPIQPDNSYLKHNINLVPFQTFVGGSGSISGNVSQLFNNSTSFPVAGIEVLLLNMQNKPLRLMKTDFQGNFIFPNLSYDSYKLYVESIGKISQFATVNLNSTNPTVNNVNFLIKNNNITVAADEVSADFYTMSEIYPNPTFEDAYLDIVLNKSSKIEIAIFNQLGQKVFSTSYNFSVGSERITLNTQDLSKGIYTVKFISKQTHILSKKLVVLK
jgi:hypothetical protein